MAVATWPATDRSPGPHRVLTFLDLVVAALDGVVPRMNSWSIGVRSTNRTHSPGRYRPAGYLDVPPICCLHRVKKDGLWPDRPLT